MKESVNMSNFNSIKLLLKIKDENISITGECFERTIKGQVCSIVPASLFQRPERCLNCGFSNLIVHGWKKSMVLLPKVVRFKTYLELNKCRFLCKNCATTVTSSTSLVEKNCSISHAVRQSIALDLQEKKSLTTIAKDNELSICSVSRVFDKFHKNIQPNFHWLPSVLNFDEFKSVGSTEAAMSFIFMDGQSGKLLDIVENRRTPYLEKYFLNYSRKARFAVRFIVIDMYTPYMSIIKRLFPNAKIVIDRFHVVQHMSRALSATRIRVMKQLKTSNKEDRKKYRKLKRYWRLIQMDSGKLNATNYKNYYCFNGLTTDKAIVDEILSYSEELYTHYHIYQEFLWAIKSRDAEAFQELLNKRYHNLNRNFTTAFKTLKRFSEGILHALQTPYNNGRLEGMNNHIKVLKRIAYGYRNFYNFKRRILIVQGVLKERGEERKLGAEAPKS
jgi:transposase